MQGVYKKKSHIFPKILVQISLILLDIIIMVATGLATFFIFAFYKTPVDYFISKRSVSATTTIYDRTGKHVLYEIHGEENRKIVPHEKISNNIRIATVAAEDKDFYSHKGLDIKSIFRALKKDLQSNEMKQGGSTITQQLVRNAFLSRDKTIRRKLIETILAIKIEKIYTKGEILDMYLNEVPYGSNAYGIEAASQTFFGKNAKDIELDEAALLAALTKATSYYSPYGNHQEELVKRQKEILRKIGDLGLVGREKIVESIKKNTLAKIIPFHDSIQAPHFVFFIKEELEKKYGKEAVEEGGFNVYTSLDFEMQKLAEKAILEEDQTLKKFGASNASLVALNPKNGQILAMVGSKNYFDEKIDGNVNVAVRPRQPGSSFKPFIYAKAFESGYEPEDLILDEPTNFGPDGSGKNYTPQNYDGNHYGILTLRQALAMSLNVPAVKVLRAVGIKSGIDMATRLGITTLDKNKNFGLSLAIGGAEVKLLDETSGFSVFANDGMKNNPDPFLRITDLEGKIIYENEAKNERVIDPEVARKINSILSDNNARTPIFGQNNKLAILGKQVAAKTGTTQDWKDAWTVGYTPNIAVGVWSGNNNGKTMNHGADGSYVAAPIWNKFMSEVLKKIPSENFLAYKIKKSDSKNEYKVVFYDKKTGKEINEKKAKKSKPENLEKRIELNNSEKSEGKYVKIL